MDWQPRTADSLVTWTIYDHPKDFPNHVVVRPWEVVSGGHIEPGPQWLCESLEQARELLAPLRLHRLDRQPEDDPTIMETWL